MRSVECCQLSCCSHTVSAGSSAYGIEPIWPSEYASLSLGNSMSWAENSQSASDAIELLNASVPPTPPGASGDAAGLGDAPPMCLHRVTPLSLHTWNTGSHLPPGSFRHPQWWGTLQQQNPRTPPAPLRF